ncbi:Ras-like protein family member 11B [Penaeus vannamei]|uniref:small monomeric GTPase n=2 Tax=Penaeus TaxID=133894 RepID=A0A423TPX5_PENVA|nr:Ras-like protein family member 11B [Penaeus vannamei]
MANKKDLEHIRQVPESEGRKLAEQYGCRFVEVSAAEMVSQVNDSIDGLLRQVSQLKGQTSPRLRKLSVSKMFNQLMNRTSSGGSHQEHRAVMPRVSIRDRARKRGHIRQS